MADSNIACNQASVPLSMPSLCVNDLDLDLDFEEWLACSRI